MTSVSLELTRFNCSLEATSNQAQKNLKAAEEQIKKVKLVGEQLSDIYKKFDSRYNNVHPIITARLKPTFKDFTSCTQALEDIGNYKPHIALTNISKKDRKIQKLQKKQLQLLQEAFLHSKEENAQLLLLLEKEEMDWQEEKRQFLDNIKDLKFGKNKVENALGQLSEASRELIFSVNQTQQKRAEKSEKLASDVKDKLSEARKTSSYGYKQLSHKINELQKEVTSLFSTGSCRNSRGFNTNTLISKAD